MPYKNPEDRAAYMRRYWKKNWVARNQGKQRYGQKYPWIAQERAAQNRCENRPARDKQKCRRIYQEVVLLNRAAGWRKWNVDHIIPKSKGGPHHESNLQILTAKANRDKGDYYMDDKL